MTHKRRSRHHRGVEIVVHVDDLPDKDLTSVGGIPVTTPVRTVIDIAPDLDDVDLRRVIRDAVNRRLFTVDDVHARLSEPDMVHRPGTARLRRMLAEA